MSVESLVISELVHEGSPRKMLQAGITVEYFEMCDEEIKWLVDQYERRKAITPRRFKQKFPDFELVRSQERMPDLLEELKQERAFVSVSSALDTIGSSLDVENSVEKALELQEILKEVIREHSFTPEPELVKSDWRLHYEEMKRLQAIREAGEEIGIPTGFRHLDHHWGGLQGGNLYVPLGRPGDGKSYFLAKLAVSAMLDGRRVGFFSPEMNAFQHRCRISTLLSADKRVQEAAGLPGSFRNRSLMDGYGYHIKRYKRFLEFVEEQVKGEIILLTNKWRRKKMSPAFIESKVDELGLEMLIIDPLYKLAAPTKRQLRHEELGEITDQVQGIGVGFNIPVILTNQAGRALVSVGKVPGRDASHGSDAPIQEADYVVGVKYFEEEGLLTVKGTKSRFGKGFTFDVKFNPNTGFMEETTDPEGDYYNHYDEEKVEQLLRTMEGEDGEEAT
jgi:replicative DNA helicase